MDSGATFIKSISVVKEALLLAEHGLVTSMHDPTEGGIIGGLTEIAYASGVSLIVYADKIPLAKETKIFCSTLGIDPLRLISSGVLLATVPSERVEEALEVLRPLNLKISVIGEVHENQGYLLRLKIKKGDKFFRSVIVEDELVKLRSIYGKRS